MQRELLEDLTLFNDLKIAEVYPPGLVKRWPGYALDRMRREPGNLINIIAGSEGTLAAIISAEVKVVPSPDEMGLGLIFFDSVTEAMQATVELLDLKPAAIEHMDRVLLDQTRGKREYQAARDLLDFDANPCAAVLAVEFYEHVEDRLAALQQKPLGTRKKIMQTLGEINQVWALRKVGLSLLTGCKGDAKPATCVEDVAVRPKDLPAYLRRVAVTDSKTGLGGLVLRARGVRPVASAAVARFAFGRGLEKIPPVDGRSRGADAAI